MPNNTSKERKHLSDCCKAPVIVVGGDEGTNHWECTKCEESCNDLFYYEESTPTSPNVALRDWKEEYCEKFGLCRDGGKDDGKCQCKAELKFIDSLLHQEREYERKESYAQGYNKGAREQGELTRKDLREKVLNEVRNTANQFSGAGESDCEKYDIIRALEERISALLNNERE